jgi:hypothetical protein
MTLAAWAFRTAGGVRSTEAPDTSNQADSIYRNGGNKGMLQLTKHGGGYVGAFGDGCRRVLEAMSSSPVR